MKKTNTKLKPVPTVELLKLDLGCGKNKKEGFVGADALKLPGVDQVVDLRGKWPWKTGSVGEVWCSHFIEHLTAVERCHFANELYRVLVPGGKATLIAPHWASCRAYGDPTHQWPPMGEMWPFYLGREWRATQAPHTDAANWAPGYSCDFDIQAVPWSVKPELNGYSPDRAQYAVQNYKESVLDIAYHLVRRA